MFYLNMDEIKRVRIESLEDLQKLFKELQVACNLGKVDEILIYSANTDSKDNNTEFARVLCVNELSIGGIYASLDYADGTCGSVKLTDIPKLVVTFLYGGCGTVGSSVDYLYTVNL